VAAGTAGDRVPLFLYAIPSFNNPTGRCTSEKDRIALLELTKRYNLPVVSDEVYQLLNFTKEIRAYIATRGPDDQPHTTLRESDSKSDIVTVPRAMSSFGFDHVFSLGSFAKILAPGLRVGWVELPTDAHTEAFLDLGIFHSGGNIAHFNSCVVATCMELREKDQGCPLWTHIGWLRNVYAAKWYALVNSICKYSAELLPEGEDNQIQIEGVHGSGNVLTGGYFIWVRFPEWCGMGENLVDAGSGSGLTHEEFLDLAVKKFNVTFRLGRDCIVPGSARTDKCMYGRLCFARRTEDELKQGAEQLCRFIQHVYTLKK
jgi:DNA-binding transcriptional MocR family regulator